MNYYQNPSYMTESKAPPNSMQAEQAVLGSLMMDNQTWDSVSGSLTENDFYFRNHQLIFRVIKQLAEKQVPFDIVTMSDELKDRKELDNIGGISYLTILVEDTPTAANIVAYAEKVKEKSRLRDLIKIGIEITQSAFDGDIDAAQSKAQGIGGIDEKAEAQEWQTDLSADIDFMIPEHFGVAAEIQRWILKTSTKQQPALAFAATLTIMSAVVGRYLSCDGIKGNFMSICIADSTEGKDRPIKCVKEILDNIGLDRNHQGEANSGAALMDILESQPNTALLLDEVGHYFSAMKGSGASQYTKEVMPIITQLYTSAGDSYKEKAKKAQEGRVIVEPNLTLLGMTTERQIFDGFRTSELSDGSLGRLGVFFGNRNVRINVDALDIEDRSVPISIIDKLMELKNQVGNNDFSPFMSSKKIQISEQYKALKKQMIVDFNDKGIAIASNGGSKAMFKPFYGRLAVQAVQVSLLINQCGSVEVLQWAADTLEKNTEIFIKKFIHGAADNENERQFKLIEKSIKEAGKKGITAKELSSATRQVMSSHKKAIIDELLLVGKIFTEDKYFNGSRKATTVYFWRK